MIWSNCDTQFALSGEQEQTPTPTVDSDMQEGCTAEETVTSVDAGKSVGLCYVLQSVVPDRDIALEKCDMDSE